MVLVLGFRYDTHQFLGCGRSPECLLCSSHTGQPSSWFNVRICCMDTSGALPRELAHVHISSEPPHYQFENELLSPGKERKLKRK